MLTEHHLKCLTTNSHGAYPRHGQDFARYDTLDITSRTGGRYLNRKYMIHSDEDSSHGKVAMV